MKEIIYLFPEPIRSIIDTHIASNWHMLQEIRIRIHQPIEFVYDHKSEWLERVVITKTEITHIINQISEFSLYRLEDELREGYITIEGGHRVGLAGKVNTESGTVKALQHITFLNIRIAKQTIGSASEIIPYLFENGYSHTLIVGPPQTGKTTIIRDLSRLISSGWGGRDACKVGIIDERSEIGASIKGIPQHDLGRRTDILDACPKADGMMMMIRSMSPEILIVDEIGSEKDVHALLEAVHAGVIVICTVHGNALHDLEGRPSLKPLFKQKIFKRIIVLERHHEPGTIKHIYNRRGIDIFHRTGQLR